MNQVQFLIIWQKIFEKGINIYSYNSTEYIKDMGTPKRFKKIESDLKRIFSSKEIIKISKSTFSRSR